MEHNISAVLVKAFAETVEKAGFADAVLFSAVRDKDYEEMIKYLVSIQRRHAIS